MPRKKQLPDEVIVEINAEPEDDGMGVAEFPDVVEYEAAKEYHHARIPRELIPFVEYQDKFFSPLRQLALAQRRRNQAEYLKEKELAEKIERYDYRIIPL